MPVAKLDDVVIHVAEGPALEIQRNDTRRAALERIRAFRLKLPVDWKFDRDEANER
ncbi:hypothetical protein [Rhizobium sp. RAF56]|jgi:antitoxin MazE|uniref:hypothetical protein n=1 Tax=Rhizobium sp. RAF56 TaxID=3233062 RepID=UPI003F981595